MKSVMKEKCTIIKYDTIFESATQVTCCRDSRFCIETVVIEAMYEGDSGDQEAQHSQIAPVIFAPVLNPLSLTAVTYYHCCEMMLSCLRAVSGHHTHPCPPLPDW